MIYKLLLLIVFYIVFVLIGSNVVYCGNSALLPMIDDQSSPSESMAPVDRTLHDNDKLLKRDKRYLLWTGGGISKIVLGFLAPVETRDHVNWRTLNLAYNFQAQYIPIPTVAFLWDRFSRNLRNQRRQFHSNEIHESKDLTREMVYGAIELYLDNNGKHGRQCLLKSICDAAEHPIAPNGILEEIIHLILTPNIDDKDSNDYKNARMAGEYGGNCAKLYQQCQFGDGLLDKISKFNL